jgi:hypothetical protein
LQYVRGIYGVYKLAEKAARAYSSDCLLYQYDCVGNDFINGKLVLDLHEKKK